MGLVSAKEVASLKDDITQMQLKLNDLSAINNGMSARITELSETLDKKEKEWRKTLQAEQAISAAKDTRIALANAAAVAEKDKAEVLQRTIDEQGATIKQLSTAVAERDKTLAVLNAVAAHNSQLQSQIDVYQRQEVDRLRSEIVEAKRTAAK